MTSISLPSRSRDDDAVLLLSEMNRRPLGGIGEDLAGNATVWLRRGPLEIEADGGFVQRPF